MSNLSKQRFALLCNQGTACAETVLDGHEYLDANLRADVERKAQADPSKDAPITGTWTDVSDNDFFQ